MLRLSNSGFVLPILSARFITIERMHGSREPRGPPSQRTQIEIFLE